MGTTILSVWRATTCGRMGQTEQTPKKKTEYIKWDTKRVYAFASFIALKNHSENKIYSLFKNRPEETDMYKYIIEMIERNYYWDWNEE